MYKKGQLVTIDFVGSVAIYVFVFIGIIVFWNIYSLRFDAILGGKEMAFKAVKITDLLVENLGVPTDWNETNVAVVGLVSNDRKLDVDKLSAFKNVTYSEIKELFNIELFDFYFRIVDLNGALVNANGQFMEIGNLPGGNKESIIKIRRLVLYGSQKVILEFSMWK